jgi:predicted O-methyltransferase YrrM
MGGWPTFDGYITEQSQEALDLMRLMLLEETDITRIVEVGTGHGGSSLHFGSCISPTGGKVLTIDREKLMDNGYLLWTGAAARRGVTFLYGDAFAPATVQAVADFIKGGRALIFCDDGNKAKEVATYTPILKPGDLLYAHDYGGEITDAMIMPETAALLVDHKQAMFPARTTIMSRMRKR